MWVTSGWNVMMLNSPTLSLTSSVTGYMLFYKRSAWWNQLSGVVLVLMDAVCWVSWEESIGTPYSTGSSWRPLSIAYFHSLLLPFLFNNLGLLLLSSVSWCQSCFVYSSLSMQYTVEIVPLRAYVGVLLSCDSRPIW